jgi:hypothetical protein
MRRMWLTIGDTVVGACAACHGHGRLQCRPALCPLECVNIAFHLHVTNGGNSDRIEGPRLVDYVGAAEPDSYVRQLQ